jgi:hypothetical protein
MKIVNLRLRIYLKMFSFTNFITEQFNIRVSKFDDFI